MTKLANIMFTYELAERLEGTGVTANCMHPGAVNTSFGTNNRGTDDAPLPGLQAVHEVARAGGRHRDLPRLLARRRGDDRPVLSDRKPIEPTTIGLRRACRQSRLWEESERLTGLKVTA